MGGIRPRSQGITSSTKIIANIFISFIGAGMLGLPYAFKEAGLVEGAVIMSIVGYLSTAAMLMLIDCKYAILAAGGRTGGRAIVMERKAPLLPPSSEDEESDSDEGSRALNRRQISDLTYGDVGLYAYGPLGKRLVDVAVVVSQIGFCCGYLIYLCKNLSVYASVLSQHQWLLLLLPPLYCLTLLRHLNKLALFSLFAQVSNVFALAVVFWFDFSHSESVPFVPKEFSIKGMPFFFAVAIYCYEGAGLILSMEESVAEPQRRKFRTIFMSTMICLTLLYISFGSAGYLSFGPHTEDIITLNLPRGQGAIDFAALVKVCLGISLFFTYPMMLFPVSHLLDKSCNLHTTARGNIARLAVVCVSGMVVMVIPNFGILISLIGATCCTLLAFILPALFHMKIFRSRLTKQQWYFNWMLICLGVMGTVVGLWDTFNRMGHDALVSVDELSHNSPLNLTNVGSARVVEATNGSSLFFLQTTQTASINGTDSLSQIVSLGNNNATIHGNFGDPQQATAVLQQLAKTTSRNISSSSKLSSPTISSLLKVVSSTGRVMSSKETEMSELQKNLFELQHGNLAIFSEQTLTSSVPVRTAPLAVPDMPASDQRSLDNSDKLGSVGNDTPSPNPEDTAPRIRKP